MPIKDPLLNRAAVAELRPTQITVGFAEVAEKRRLWQAMPDHERSAFLARHIVRRQRS